MFFYGFKERMFARRWWGFGGIYMIKKEGEVVGYIGANGAGKSTTIKMMAGILTPTSGKILSFIVVVLFATFTGYFPGAYFLGKGSFGMGVCLTVVVSILAIIIAYSIWLTGIKKYESSGS